MALIFPEGTQNYPAGTAKCETQEFSSRATFSTAANWDIILSGSYTKLSDSSVDLLVTVTLGHFGEQSGAGATNFFINSTNHHGQFQWGGYGGYQRVSTYTYLITGWNGGTSNWTLYHYYRGFSVLNPSSSDSSNINNSYRGPSTVTFQELI